MIIEHRNVFYQHSHLKGVMIFLVLMTFSTFSAAQGADDDLVTIQKSGSTNSGSYSVGVARDGSTVFKDGQSQKKGQIDKMLADKFFADVEAAAPLDKLSPAHCAKSVSFGTSTTVTFRLKTSPDISCGSSPAAPIYQDTFEIETALHIGRSVLRYR